MPEVIFEPNSDIYTVDWGKYGGSGGYYNHVNYDGNDKYIYTTHELAQWRDIRFGIDMAGFTGVGKSINFIQVQFRCASPDPETMAKAVIRCGNNGSAPWFTDYGSARYLNAVWTDYTDTWPLNPAVINTWEWVDILKLEIGLSGRPHYDIHTHDWSPVYCPRLYLLVDYNNWITPPEEMSGFFL